MAEVVHSTHRERSLYKKVKARFGELKVIRQPYEPMRERVIDMLRPDLSAWSDTGIDAQGKTPGLMVYSGHPHAAVQIWRKGMQGRLVSPSLDWFIYTHPDDNLKDLPEVRKWLKEYEDAVYALMRNSNYYSHMGPYMTDGGTIGEAGSWIEKNKAGDAIVCSNFHPQEVYADANADGQVDTFYRGPFQLTARNAVEMFGKEKLSQALQNALEKNPLDRFNFIHACHHRSDPIFKGIDDKIPDRDYIDIYIQQETDVAPDREKPLRLTGYWTKPFTLWRYSISSRGFHGVGLGCFALVDIYGINSFTQVMMRAGHISVNPPMYADSTLRPWANRFSRPGGRLWGDLNTLPPKPIFEGGKYPYGADTLDRAAAAINRWFNVDFFLMLSNQDKVYTATQILQMANERAILLGPEIGRFEEDKLDQDHERIADLAIEMGMVPDPPAILQDSMEEEREGGKKSKRVQVEYNGLLARAQREYREIKRTEISMAKIKSVLEVAPEERHRIKWGKVLTRLAREGQGIEEEEIATDEEVAVIQQQQAEAQQAAMALEAGKGIADAVPKLQKKTEKDSPLAQLQEAGT